MDTNKKVCTRQGCRKHYTEEGNLEGTCKYHDGKPIFHDLKKGWTCCNKIVYDWDEFQKIEGCKVGKHTDEKQKTDFFQSQTVATAQKGLDRSDAQPKSIVDYEKEQKKIEEEKKRKEEQKPKQVVTNNKGQYFCGNPGCVDKLYDPNAENKEGSCKHHLGQPVFHDRKKYWTCCKQEAYDWDDFMKLSPCAVGKHTPKYK